MSVRRLDEYFRQLGRAVRAGQVDVEGVLRALVDSLLRELRLCEPQASASAPSLESIEGRMLSLERRLQELASTMNALVKAVDELRREVAGLRRELEPLRTGLAAVERKEAPNEKHPKWLRELLSKVRDKGYVLLHELGPYIDKYDPDLAAKHGLVTISAGSDVVSIHYESLKEFLTKLSTLKTSDDVEAASMLGRYAQLFNLMRRAGIIIFKGGWKVDESVLRALERVERAQQHKSAGAP